nr:hypothetical protein [Tanacetum cinerariifolium]
MKARATTTMTAKLPILNLGEYDRWLIRIEQYFLVTGYSLWEVIKNGNKVLKKTVWISGETYEPTSAEEKLDKRNKIKARGTLLMVLPNKDQLKFHSYQDEKLLMEAIEKSTSSTNEADTTASGVSTAHTQGTTVNSTYVDNLSDAVICTFLASQPNSPQLAKEDLVQIDPDDLEEIDLHWEMAMLTIKARRAPKNQDNRGREYGRKTVLVETPIENALIAQDGIGGYDWSYQAEEEIPTDYAFMALKYSRSSLSSESEVDSCSKSCLKAYANLKEQYDSLTFDYKKSQYNLLSYKAGNYMPPKCDLRLINEHFESVSVDVISNIAPSDVKTVKTIDVNHKGVFNTEEPKLVMKNNFSPPIIEDWHSDDESKRKLSLKKWKRKKMPEKNALRAVWFWPRVPSCLWVRVVVGLQETWVDKGVVKVAGNGSCRCGEKMGFAAVLAVLKPERLKADSARMCEEASKVKSCPSEIILDDLLALESIVRFDFE